MKGTHLSSSAKRIQKELAEISLDPPCNCSAGPKGDNIYEWVSTILGPSGMPYILPLTSLEWKRKLLSLYCRTARLAVRTLCCTQLVNQPFKWLAAIRSLMQGRHMLEASTSWTLPFLQIIPSSHQRCFLSIEREVSLFLSTS